MINKFKIKHIGFHRLGIILGVIFVIIGPWFIDGLDSYRNDFEILEIIDTHLDLLYEVIESGYYFLILLYPVFYLVGYFSLKLIYWIISGFR